MINLDNTSRVNFDRCEQYYYLRNIRNLVPLEPQSMAPYFGGAIHKGLERWYKGGSEEESIKEFALEYMKWFDEKDDERTPGNGMEILKAFFNKWGKDYLTTLEINGVRQIEVGFGLPLDLTKYECEEEVYYTGRIDRVCRDNEKVVILDWKTTYYIGSGFVLPKPNSQFTGYIWGARETLGLPIEECYIDFIGTKIRKQVKVDGKIRKLEVGDPLRVEIGRDSTKRGEEDFEEWKQSLALTVNRIGECRKREMWPKRTHSCPSFRGCEFIPICEKGRMMKEGVIKTLFREEEWKPWEEIG